jgi:hypothetical protein
MTGRWPRALVDGRPARLGRAWRFAVGATTCALVSAVVLIGSVLGADATTSQATRLSDRDPCASRVRPIGSAVVPAEVRAWAHNGPVLGGGRIWTQASALNVPAEFGSGIWALKFPWYLYPATGGVPTLSGRRLDGPGHFRGTASAALGGPAPRWVASGLDFSTLGCWQVTARYRGSSLTLRLVVHAGTTSTIVGATGSTPSCGVPQPTVPQGSLEVVAVEVPCLCPTQRVSPSPGDDPMRAASMAALEYFHDKAGWDSRGRYVTAVYQVGDTSQGSYSSVFAFSVPTFCGAGVASSSYGVELINPTIQDTGRLGAVVVAHFAVGWCVWGVYHGPVGDNPGA